MKRFLVLCLCLMLLCSGCATHGTEEQLMVVAFGVDQQTPEEIKIIVRVPSFSGSSEGGSSSSDNYLTLTASGSSFPSALSLLYATSPRSLNFSQTREILLGEGTRAQTPQLLDMIGRIQGMRSQATVAFCTGKAEEVINSQQAVIGTRLSRYIDTTLETGIREGYIPAATLIRVITRISGGYRDALLALVGQNDQEKQKQKQQNSKQQEQPAMSQAIDELAGKSDNISGKVIDWMGAAAMDGSNIAGLLDGYETTLCRFLTREVGVLPFETDEGTLSLTPRLGPFLSIKKDNETLTLHIFTDLNVLPNLGAQINLKQTEKAIEDSILSLLHKLQNMRCDALGFGGIAIRRYLTLDAWEKSDWKSVYAAAAVNVDVRLTLLDE